MKAQSTAISKRDYENLASFRAAIRKFVRFTEEGARAAGITPQQHQVMLGIMGQHGRQWASIGEIADFLQIRHHTAVELVDRCVTAGLVERHLASEDRRQVQVTLTPHGEELLARFSVENLRELRSLQKFIHIDSPV